MTADGVAGLAAGEVDRVAPRPAGREVLVDGAEQVVRQRCEVELAGVQVDYLGRSRRGRARCVVGGQIVSEVRGPSFCRTVRAATGRVLRQEGVVGKFVEFYGEGLDHLSLADRATIANMAPEYGATCGFFPVDDETLAYLKLTGRSASQIALVEAYAREQSMFREDSAAEAAFTRTLSLDLATVVPSLAGPKRPQDRVALTDIKPRFLESLATIKAEGNITSKAVDTVIDDQNVSLADGAVVIAAITSCTNTSNPSVMVGAGLVAKKAVELGLTVKPWVKPSLAPGSRVVTAYLDEAKLTDSLQALGFHTVGYGCTTCIGNSGPLPEPVSKAIHEGDLSVCSVLSGNRNFEGRVHAEVRMNYLASPPLVVAYALAGRMDIDLQTEPLGSGADGNPVYLKDIWPGQDEIRAVIADSVNEDEFRNTYDEVFSGESRWNVLESPESDRYAWVNDSTYIRKPPYFEGMTLDRTTHEGETIGVELPISVELKVAETEPGFAGDTQSGAKKPATLESGLVVQVPIFIEEGDVIKIDTRTGEYQTRV